MFVFMNDLGGNPAVDEAAEEAIHPLVHSDDERLCHQLRTAKAFRQIAGRTLGTLVAHEQSVEGRMPAFQTQDHHWPVACLKHGFQAEGFGGESGECAETPVDERLAIALAQADV